MFRPFIDFLDRRSAAQIITIASAIVVLIAIADWATGLSYSFGLFYLLPVSMPRGSRVGVAAR